VIKNKTIDVLFVKELDGFDVTVVQKPVDLETLLGTMTSLSDSLSYQSMCKKP
jgi:hypothetical protein